MIPLSLYIHIPWCERKCPYCDFNSHQSKKAIDENRYISALLFDLDQDLHNHAQALIDREIHTIFIGGGTPSLFSAKSIAQLIDGVKQRIPLCGDCEITMEANPGSSERDKFAGFRSAGLNRLSIGVQSFNAKHLSSLGRVHSSNEALLAAQYAHDAGFDNFNLDLMFGLPEQNLEQCLHDVASAIDLRPSHLSCYQLTIEPNTLFHHQPPIQPGDDTMWEMQSALQALLHKNDYHQYEVSAYAQADRRCQHNLNYWSFGDYLGIGAGAHGKVTDASGNGTVQRYWKVKHPESYLTQAQAEQPLNRGNQTVDDEQLSFEFMMNALRLSDGVPISLYTERTGLDPSTIADTLEKHLKLGLMQDDPDRLTPSSKGKQFIDSMLQDYLPDS